MPDFGNPSSFNIEIQNTLIALNEGKQPSALQLSFEPLKITLKSL